MTLVQVFSIFVRKRRFWSKMIAFFTKICNKINFKLKVHILHAKDEQLLSNRIGTLQP